MWAVSKVVTDYLISEMKAFLLAAFVLSGSSCLAEEMSDKREQFEALKALPFSDNPFFIRQIADSGQFEGNGTEGLEPREYISRIFISIFDDFFSKIFLDTTVNGLET